MKNDLYSTQQYGFTLIELLVASLLGLFLLGGVLQLFAHSKKTYKIHEALTLLQENGRYAMDVLAKDLRMAGFMGCSSQAIRVNTLAAPNDFLYRFDRAVEGFEANTATTWSPALPIGTPTPIPSATTGSDIITLRRADEHNFTVTKHNTSNADITLASTTSNASLKSTGFLQANGTNNCAIAAITNCSALAIFQISSITGTTLAHAKGGNCSPQNTTTDLGESYVNSQVWPLHTISYYIRKNPGNQQALYRKTDTDNAEELIEGIEQMQILYGVDSNTPADGTPNYYVPANAVTQWQTVFSVRISLLLTSLEDNLTDHPVSYTYNGITKPGDRHLRKVFTSTIALRNQLL